MWQEDDAHAIECLSHLKKIVGKSGNEIQYHSSTNLRVNKWDALILDTEILGLMKYPIKNMFAFFQPGLMEKLLPEIDGLMLSMLYLFSIGMKKPTPGMALQNLKYASSCFTWKKTVPLFLISVVIPYGWKRIHRMLLSWRWREGRTTESEERYQHFLTLLHRASTMCSVLSLLNHIAFFKYGKFRTLPERLVGMTLEQTNAMLKPRAITFEYMNRQLVWDGLVEFGSFMLPLINWDRMWRFAKRIKYILPEDSAELSSSGCPICSTSPAKTPYITSCGHVYCYYCLQTSVMNAPDFNCVVCGEVFETSHRLGSDVDRSASQNQ